MFHTWDVHLTTVSRFGGPLDECFTFRTPGGQFCKKNNEKQGTPQKSYTPLAEVGQVRGTPKSCYTPTGDFFATFCDLFSTGQTPFVMVNEYDSFGERYPSEINKTLFRSVFWQLFLPTELFISLQEHGKKKAPREISGL